mgnify:CR=1 FL=1|jgi:cysteine desulfurase
MIYLDHAASTPVKKEVLEVMTRWMGKVGNPQSSHKLGRDAKDAILEAKETISARLRCSADELVFTSGATESINLAIQGIARKKSKGHIIISAEEHPCVHSISKALARQGFTVTTLGVDNTGLVNKQELINSIRKDTILFSVHTINNDIGTIQNISELAKACRENGILIHADSSQGIPKGITTDCDLVTYSGAKLGGPKSIGLLYLKRGVEIEPLIYGSSDQIRGGTPNVASIVGFSKAVEIYTPVRVEMRNYAVEQLGKIGGRINGPADSVATHIISVTFSGVDARMLVRELSDKEIYVSQGSACTSGDLEASEVLLALGMTKSEALSTIRVSMSNKTTQKEIDTLCSAIKEISSKKSSQVVFD